MFNRFLKLLLMSGCLIHLAMLPLANANHLDGAPDIPIGLDPGAILNSQRFNMQQQQLLNQNMDALMTPIEPVIIDEYGILPIQKDVHGQIQDDSEIGE